MLKYIGLFSFFFSIYSLSSAQLVYISNNILFKLGGNNLVDDTATATPSLFINGSIENNGTMQNNGELQLTGNFTNNFDFFTEGDEVFVGDSLQTINGIFVEGGYFHNLVLAKSSNHIQLNTDIDVISHLNFASGWIDGNGFLTFMQSNEQWAVHNGGASGTYNNYLAGTLKQYMNSNVFYTFPIGNIAHGCQNAQINFSNLSDGENLTISYHGDSLGLVDYNSCSNTKNFTSSTGDWELTMDGTNGTYNYSITLLPAGLNQLESSNFDAIRKDGIFVTDECANISGNHTAQNLTSFSHFVILGGVTAFPISMTSFQGRWEGNNIILNWLTESENNSDYFEIERMISNNRNSNTWESIGNVKAVGNNQQITTYQYEDSNVYVYNSNQKPIIYYRLKMIDKDGTYTYSNVIEFVISNLNTCFTIYPNPTQGEIKVVLNHNISEKYTLILTDVQGKYILTQLYDPLITQIGTLDLSILYQGVYFLTIVNEKGQLKEIIRIMKL